jgi:hypothetical protein
MGCQLSSGLVIVATSDGYTAFPLRIINGPVLAQDSAVIAAPISLASQIPTALPDLGYIWNI